MNDRELLELAAKAAGYKVRWHERWGCHVHVDPHNIDSPPTTAGQRHVWVPLNDDGDALRLAVRLNIEIHLDLTVGSVVTAFMIGKLGHNTFEEVGENEDCPYRSTRRAIVRAAAEIGKSVKERIE